MISICAGSYPAVVESAANRQMRLKVRSMEFKEAKGYVRIMPERIEAPDSPNEAPTGKCEEIFRRGEEPSADARGGASEHWLQKCLRQAFDDVSNEPLPSELSDLVDRLRADRSKPDHNHENVAQASRSSQGKS